MRQRFDGEPCDLLVALHARKSAPSVFRFARERPGVPIVVALTGTDLYRDIRRSASARRALAAADRLVVLQAHGVGDLPRAVRGRARVIHQSALRPKGEHRPAVRTFDVCVLGHLRPVKDPFRAAMAVRRLPAESRLRVVHLGAALSDSMRVRAEAEVERNERYEWRGEQPRWKSLRVLARSRLLVLSSRLEGGANVVSEAIACGVPVITSRIRGSLGILGDDYPGTYPVGDTAALRRLLLRAETDAAFLADLTARCRKLAPLVDPGNERAAWAALLDELSPSRR
jgi:putative glycosyltransferase (TIGR04348 family)